MGEISDTTEIEVRRVKALKKYNILDTPPDGSFDRITRLASKLLNVPIAIVSLVDVDRIWFKSRYGIDVEQIDRNPGLCASAILSDELYLVEDAIKDPRTLANPLVAGQFGLRFYAAVPLKVREGYNLGTLCVIDKNPRKLTEEEKEILYDLADVLIDQIELRLEARKSSFQQNQILSIAAHEIKNPLTTIPIWSELIKEEAGENRNIAEMCDSIQRASTRMTTVINDMLENARMQASQINLRYSEFDLGDLVNRIAAINQVLARSKKQTLYVNTLPVTIRADETKISEIIDNLVNNAIKYSPLGSEIFILLKQTNRKVIIEIEDQGPGLTDKDIDQLFLPFTRLSARPTGGESSTGLGLSIVKLLVEAHNGSIWTKSNYPKKGVTFIVEIPLTKEK